MMPAPAKVRVTTVRPLTRLTDWFNGMAGPPASGVRTNAPERVTALSKVTVTDVTADRCTAPPFATDDCTVANGGRLVNVKADVEITPGAAAEIVKMPGSPALNTGACATPSVPVRATATVGGPVTNVPE